MPNHPERVRRNYPEGCPPFTVPPPDEMLEWGYTPTMTPQQSFNYYDEQWKWKNPWENAIRELRKRD